jgi:hypothetical protein
MFYLSASHRHLKEPAMPVPYAPISEARADERAPYVRSATGYGPKLATRYWVRLSADSPTARWRRVWAVCYGNAASLYVVVKGEDVYLWDTDLQCALERA